SQKGSLPGQVEGYVIRLAGAGVFEEGRLLTVGVAATAVVADFAGPQLVPGLRHVEHHAVLVQRLEGPGDVRGDLGKGTGIGITVRVERLPIVIELPHRNFAEDA